MDEALLSISPAGHGQLVKIHITLEPHSIFDHILHTYIFQHCPATGMQNGDKALPNISPAGRGQLVKILITPEPHSLFG